MTDETLLLIGRETPHGREVMETHARRLRSRSAVGSVVVATYDSDPERELRGQLADLSADRVFALPLVVAHTRETETDVPRALRHVPGAVEYIDPVGRDPALTAALADRAAARHPPTAPTSIVLVAFGSSSLPHQRRVAEYHAERLAARTDYDEVEPSFLLQNPAVECARYTVSNDRVVAVPLFVAHGPATREHIPERLDLDRGGIAYAEPIGDHRRLTDVLHGALEKRRVLAERDASGSSGLATPTTAEPVATDGDGR